MFAQTESLFHSWEPGEPVELTRKSWVVTADNYFDFYCITTRWMVVLLLSLHCRWANSLQVILIQLGCPKTVCQYQFVHVVQGAGRHDEGWKSPSQEQSTTTLAWTQTQSTQFRVQCTTLRLSNLLKFPFTLFLNLAWENSAMWSYIKCYIFCPSTELHRSRKMQSAWNGHLHNYNQCFQ